MVAPQFLLDALNKSVTSGTFIDTKLHVFSGRDASGRVGSPRSLYCNDHVLSTVPYFSTLFSDRFLEGKTRDINGGLPSDTLPYTDSYDYLSDSDLEDESSSFGEDEEPAGGHKSEPPHGAQDSPGSQVPLSTAPEKPRQQGPNGDENHHERDNGSVRMGKVAFIRDVAAVTVEAVIYYIYTGEITFASFISDPRNKLPVGTRAGDWSRAKPPSPSAKSVYRLADMYDIPALKELAKAHIYENLAHCDIVDEVFSSFSFSFPEILSAQVSQLVRKMKEESTSGTESDTRRQLREKIASLSRSQLERASDTLAMIWNGVVKPPELPAPQPRPTVPANSTLSRQVQLALLRSISMGVFIDVQFYAYNMVQDGVPVDLKPLFTSSLVIEEWAPAISMHTVGMESQAACLMDGLADDYEYLHGGNSNALHKGKTVVKHYTEVSAAAGSREVTVLMSGAWKTWMSLFSFSYTNGMSFAPLQSSIHDDPVTIAETQWQRSCSPRSIYSLSTSLGIENLKEDSLKDIQSKLTTSNVIQELFTSFAASHKPVMDMEIEFFLKKFDKKNPKLLMEHIQRMASGEAQYLSETLSLVYDKFFEDNFRPPVASSSGLGTPPVTAGQDTLQSAHATQASTPIVQESNPTPNQPSISEFGTTFHPWPQIPAPSPGPSNTAVRIARLECSKCGIFPRLQDLYNGLRCPVCPERSAKKGRPKVKCELCRVLREVLRDTCVNRKCQAIFV